MALHQVTCWIAVCDLCGHRSDDTEYGIHHASAADAVADLTTAYDNETPWTADGSRLICPRPDQGHHEARIPIRGWHPGSEAMSITYTPDKPLHAVETSLRSTTA